MRTSFIIAGAVAAATPPPNNLKPKPNHITSIMERRQIECDAKSVMCPSCRWHFGKLNLAAIATALVHVCDGQHKVVNF